MTGTIIDVTVPTAQFALERSLAEFEGVTFEVKQMVATNRDCLMPFVHIGTTDSGLDEALTADDSVADFERIATSERDCLYQLEWTDRIERAIRMLVDQKGTILTAVGQDDTWHLRLLFADREAVASTDEYCREHGIEFDVENLQMLSDCGSNRFGLTDSQQTALRLAAARGYYSVPRGTTAEDLAAELGVTHQAVSERLRRGHENLINHAFGAETETVNPEKSARTEPEADAGIE